MHQLVVGLSGVEVIADDFVVVGFGDSMEDASFGASGVEVIADDFFVGLQR